MCDNLQPAAKKAKYSWRSCAHEQSHVTNPGGDVAKTVPVTNPILADDEEAETLPNIV